MWLQNKKYIFICFVEIIAREHGSNKKLAAQSSALSIVRQLYHLGVIEPYSGVTKKKEGEIVSNVFYCWYYIELLHWFINDMVLMLYALFVHLILYVSRLELSMQQVFLMYGWTLVSSQLEAFEVNVVDDLQHQLQSMAQELGVVIPPPVSLIYMRTFINLYTVSISVSCYTKAMKSTLWFNMRIMS